MLQLKKCEFFLFWIGRMSSSDAKTSPSPATALDGIQKPSRCEKVNGVVGTSPCTKLVRDPQSLSVNMKQRIRTFAPMCTSYFCFYAGSCFSLLEFSLSKRNAHNSTTIPRLAMAALFPYLSVYIKGLGISPDEVALLGALTPVIALVTRPAFALLADKSGLHKLVWLWIWVLGWFSTSTTVCIPCKFIVQYMYSTMYSHILYLIV